MKWFKERKRKNDFLEKKWLRLARWYPRIERKICSNRINLGIIGGHSYKAGFYVRE
jgi:hypothetical protein